MGIVPRLAPSLIAVLGAAVVLACAPRARCAEPVLPLDLARIMPDPGGALLMLEPGPGPLPLLAPRFSLSVLGAHAPLRYVEDDEVVHAVDDAFGVAVGAALGLGVGDVGVVLPIHLVLSGTRDGDPWEATSLGDLVVVPRMAIPLGPSVPLDVLLSAAVTLPTGDETTFAGRAGATVHPRLRLAVSEGRVRVAVRPGLLLQGGSELLSPALSDAFTVRLAAGIGLGPTRAVQPELGLDAAVPLDRPEASSAELLVGLTAYPGANLAVSAHGGFGLGWMPGVPAARLLVGIAWEAPGRPARSDREGDGSSGRWDRCPASPEDRDGFRDRDGCPDPDDDGDGVPDIVDPCPRRAGEPGDGCPS
jgi:hypothetical protein